MKKIKTTAGAFAARLCAAGLSLLGFTACEDNMRCMYGSPFGTYEVKGTVVTERDTPVEGALVIVKHTDGVPLFGNRSNAKGEYVASDMDSGLPDSLRVVCYPPADSGLEADSVKIKTDEAKLRSDTRSTIVDFKLRDKKE